MTAPIDIAFAALCEAVASALVDAGFIATAERLEIDPASACETSGDETSVQTSAQIFGLEITPVRPLMGGGTERWVVDRDCGLELAAFGPAAAGEDDYKARLADALTAIAPLARTDPTLGQTCERVTLTGSEDADMPPNGQRVIVKFTIRLRAGDPLGRTAP